MLQDAHCQLCVTCTASCVLLVLPGEGCVQWVFNQQHVLGVVCVFTQTDMPAQHEATARNAISR